MRRLDASRWAAVFGIALSVCGYLFGGQIGLSFIIFFGTSWLIIGLYVGPKRILRAFEKNRSARERPFLVLSGIAFFLGGFMPFLVLWSILTLLFPCDIYQQSVCFW